ncbi:MAG: hypothetical protein NTX17_00885 [Candidatus Eisenbacteria bacterium]|nr:hypothetical protein [Candidatus Eisenbacteria bacterium]
MKYVVITRIFGIEVMEREIRELLDGALVIVWGLDEGNRRIFTDRANFDDQEIDRIAERVSATSVVCIRGDKLLKSDKVRDFLTSLLGGDKTTVKVVCHVGAGNTVDDVVRVLSLPEDRITGSYSGIHLEQFNYLALAIKQVARATDPNEFEAALETLDGFFGARKQEVESRRLSIAKHRIARLFYSADLDFQSMSASLTKNGGTTFSPDDWLNIVDQYRDVRWQNRVDEVINILKSIGVPLKQRTRLEMQGKDCINQLLNHLRCGDDRALMGQLRNGNLLHEWLASIDIALDAPMTEDDSQKQDQESA